MSNFNQVLSTAAETILFSNDYHRMHQAVNQLHTLFAEASGVKATDIIDEDIETPNGKAVSPIKAVHCLLEIDRTRKFLTGIYQALRLFTAQYPSERIHILYAGCGPYATLLTPLTSFFSSTQVSFSLLDINSFSLDACRLLYDNLELMPYVNEFICADAATYQLTKAERTHIIISETMLNALRKEPQLSIMHNLIPQLDDEAIFIPEEISIDAALLNWQEEYQSFITENYSPERIYAGNVYKATRNFKLPSPVIIPLPQTKTHENLSLLTEIRVFGNACLTAYNCSLTLPYSLDRLTQDAWPAAVKLEYHISEDPKFDHTLIYDQDK